MSASRCGIVAAAFLLAAPALADWRASFREGVRATDLDRWEEAVRHFQAAIEERPSDDPDKVNIASNRFISYIPNAYLGMALAKLGRCEEALHYFDQTEAQRVAPDREPDKYRPMLAERSRCVNLLMESALKEAEPALSAAQQAANQLGDASLRNAIESDPELARRYQEALEKLRVANERAQAAVASSHPPSVRQAGELARQAEQTLVAVRRDAITRRDSGAAEELARARESAQQAIARARGSRDELTTLRRRAEAQAAWRQDASLGRAEGEASAQLAEAEELAGRSGADVESFGRAATLGQRASEAFAELGTRTRDRIAQATRVEQQAEDAMRELREAIAAAEQARNDLVALREAEKLRTAWRRTPELGQREQRLGSDLERARQTASQPSPQPPAVRTARDLAVEAGRGFRALADELRRLEVPGTETESQPPASILPPPALRDAVDAYFRGEFSQTLTLLENLDVPAFADTRVAAQAYLFRAAASYAAYRLENDEALRRAAVESIARAKAAAPDLVPSEKYFPPPFLELFRNGGSE